MANEATGNQLATPQTDQQNSNSPQDWTQLGRQRSSHHGRPFSLNPKLDGAQRLVVKLAEPGADNSCLTVILLLLSFLTSVFTTLFLSVVINSIRLSDKGVLLGNIAWDQKLESSTLELPASLPNKSVSLKSIEPTNGNALSFRIRSSARQAANSTHSIIVSNPADNNCPGRRPHDIGCKSNYLALNVNNKSKLDPFLEIGTKSLVLDLFDPVKLATVATGATAMGRSIDNGNNSFNLKKGGAQSTSSLASSQQVTANGRERVLEMDGRLQSITLTRDNQLRLSPPTSGSLIVNSQAKSSQVTGPLDDNLDVQTRNGILTCHSGDAMDLMSRSADIKLSAVHQLKIASQKLDLDAEHIHIRSGIQYFDSEPALNEDKDTWKELQRQTQLNAYSLISVDGIIIAS